jgi:membrane protease YdiL (CAAX protease family)
MPNDGFLQLLTSLFLVTIFFLITWLVTRFYRPKRLEAKFGVPRKEALLAIGYSFVAFLVLAVVFFFWAQSTGGTLNLSEEYTIIRVLCEWIIYGALSFVPIIVILRIRRQKAETVGVARSNLRLSIVVGLVFSALWLSVNTTPERFLSRVFTYNTFYALMYYLPVGFGEELLFRGFLQLRCSAWLGEIKGLAVASVIMAFAHLPQRIFVTGANSLQAVISAMFLIPVSLLMGFLMLRTQNVLGPTVLHTIMDLTNLL